MTVADQDLAVAASDRTEEAVEDEALKATGEMEAIAVGTIPELPVPDVAFSPGVPGAVPDLVAPHPLDRLQLPAVAPAAFVPRHRPGISAVVPELLAPDVAVRPGVPEAVPDLVAPHPLDRLQLPAVAPAAFVPKRRPGVPAAVPEAPLPDAVVELPVPDGVPDRGAGPHGTPGWYSSWNDGLDADLLIPLDLPAALRTVSCHGEQLRRRYMRRRTPKVRISFFAVMFVVVYYVFTQLASYRQTPLNYFLSVVWSVYAPLMVIGVIGALYLRCQQRQRRKRRGAFAHSQSGPERHSRIPRQKPLRSEFSGRTDQLLVVTVPTLLAPGTYRHSNVCCSRSLSICRSTSIASMWT
jgi:hypothetical protein